jgi:hypothetical protein
MSWIGRLFLGSIGLLFVGMALGYGFDDRGQETGMANVLTTLAAGMYLFSIPLFVGVFYLWLAANFRRSNPSQRFVLRVFYSLWLFVPVLFLFAGRGEPGMPDRVDQTWFGTAGWVVLAIAIAVLPYALWPLAQRITKTARPKKAAP